METVKLGIVGIGTMGAIHAQNVVNGRVPRCKLTAVCDLKPERLNQFSSAEGFVSVDDFLRSSETDAVLIATPHYSHTSIGIQALGTGRHILVEKPISVHKSDAERLIAAHRRSDQVFAAMFNQRMDPFFLKLRQLVRSGDLGAIRRVNWTITDWFRTEAYYRSSDGERPGQARAAVYCSTSVRTTWICSNGSSECLPGFARFVILAGIMKSKSKMT